MGTAPHVVLRCDGGAVIGGGHVSRCVALADAFALQGWRITFACSRETLSVLPILQQRGYPIVVLDGTVSGEAAVLRLRLPDGCDTLVVDHYGRDVGFETTLRGWAGRIVALDDATGRRHDCDVLVDSGSVDATIYQGLIPTGARCLLGPEYALVRREFTDLRAEALERRRQNRLAGILVSFGATDPWNGTTLALDAMAGLLPEASIDILLSSRAPHLDHIRQRLSERVRLHLDIGNPAPFMAQADLAIGASGVSSFERAALGLPAIQVTMVDNQRAIAHMLVHANAVIDCGACDDGFPARLRQHVVTVAQSAGLRRALSTAASTLIDGRGALRVVEAIS